MKIVWLIVIVLVLLLVAVGGQYLELKQFEITKYTIYTHKVKKPEKFAVISDLHGFEYGKKNRRLLAKLREAQPDIILIAGDMIVSKYPKTYEKALDTIRELVEIAPVYYGFGNHESRADRKRLAVSKAFADYKTKAAELGVRFLRNENIEISMNEDSLAVAGLEMDLAYYEKGRTVPMEPSYVSEKIGACREDEFQILLAHNPMYSEEYAAWGADLTLCGHNHGGLIRFPGIGSLMSPQLTFFPKYNDGLYRIQGRNVIVSRGLGTHTFHIRIWNRAELVMISLLSDTLEKKSIN